MRRPRRPSVALVGRETLGVVCAVALMIACADVAPEVHFKPSPPIDLTLSVDGGDVVATATPRVDTVALEIAVAGQTRRFARVAAGESRSFRVAAGTDLRVRASARADLGGGLRPNRVAEIAVGTPPPRRVIPRRTIALPSGEVIDEVRR